jgi:cold shock CspA family protein
MSNYFNAEDVITAQGIVSNITRNGAGFISTKDGVDVFVPVRLVETSGIEMGDSVTVYMVKNFGDSSLKNINDSASHRALRVKIDGRLGNDFAEVKPIPMSIIVDPFPPVTSAIVNVMPPVTPMPQFEFEPATPTKKPKMETLELRAAILKKIEDGLIGNSVVVHAELARDFPQFDFMSNDFGKKSKLDVSNSLMALYTEGSISKALIYEKADNKKGTYTVYGLTAKGLFNAIIGA